MDIKKYFSSMLLDKNDSFLQIITKNTIQTDHWNYGVGSPLLVSRMAFDSLLDAEKAPEIDGRERRQLIKALIKYPTDPYCPFDDLVNVNTSDVHVVKEGDQCSANTHVIKKVDYFDSKKVDSLIVYVKEKGSITLDFDDVQGANGLVAALDFFKAKFRFSAYINSRCLETNKTSTFKIAMDFVDIRNVYPIFNSNQCDGIYINIYIYDPKGLRNIPIYSNLASVYTNYKTNIFEVDGADLRGMELISKSSLSYMTRDIGVVVRSKAKTIQGAQRAPAVAKAANVDIGIDMANKGYNKDKGYNVDKTEKALWDSLDVEQAEIINDFVKIGVPSNIQTSTINFLKAVRDGLIMRGVEGVGPHKYVQISLGDMAYRIEVPKKMSTVKFNQKIRNQKIQQI